MTVSLVSHRFDWSAPGQQSGYVSVEHSVHGSAYGIIRVPVAVVKNGSGPTVLLMAGVHGDEYEGQIALTRLVDALDPATVEGRIIVLPAVNTPAVMAGRRTSPLDQGNLNRLYADTPMTGPTSQIARFVRDELMPLADYCLDLHTGGSSMDCVPTLFGYMVGDEARDRQTRDLLEHLAAPFSIQSASPPLGSTGDDAFVMQGGVIISSELGGGGMPKADCLGHAERIVDRFLDFLGVCDRPWVVVGAAKTQWVASPSEGYIHADLHGVFVPTCKLGDAVAQGDVAGLIYTPETPEIPPTEVPFPLSGVWGGVRSLGRVNRGDCLGYVLVAAE